MRPSPRLPRAADLLLLLSLCAPSAAEAAGGSVLDGITAAHNRVRAANGLPSLRWSGQLAATAREWADHLATRNSCRMRHRPNNAYGENLYWHSAMLFSNGDQAVMPVAPAQVVNLWAAEKKHYDAASNRCDPGRVCGHYTQLVWRSTREVGCARSVCPDQGQVWVCNYHPAGNIIGHSPFDSPLSRQATVTGQAKPATRQQPTLATPPALRVDRHQAKKHRRAERREQVRRRVLNLPDHGQSDSSTEEQLIRGIIGIIGGMNR